MRQASEASSFCKKSKLFCEQSEQSLRMSYQNLARSANFLLVHSKAQNCDEMTVVNPVWCRPLVVSVDYSMVRVWQAWWLRQELL